MRRSRWSTPSSPARGLQHRSTGSWCPGDLSQNIGAPVRRGDTLFEIAPLDDYNVELWVPEQQVAAVVPGARGRLIVAPRCPVRNSASTVERTMPVATARDGRMVFRVDARP